MYASSASGLYVLDLQHDGEEAIDNFGAATLFEVLLEFFVEKRSFQAMSFAMEYDERQVGSWKRYISGKLQYTVPPSYSSGGNFAVA